MALPDLEPGVASSRGQGAKLGFWEVHSVTPDGICMPASRLASWQIRMPCNRLAPQIGVKNMAMRGSARLTLAPLLGELPVVGAARVSLLGMPGQQMCILWP